jgi:hypothetical protein
VVVALLVSTLDHEAASLTASRGASTMVGRGVEQW